MIDKTLDCGCRYIKAAASLLGEPRWWQVVACPAHGMHFAPLDEEPS